MVQRKCVGRHKEDWRSRWMYKLGKSTKADGRLLMPPMLPTTNLRTTMSVGRLRKGVHQAVQMDGLNGTENCNLVGISFPENHMNRHKRSFHCHT